MRVHHLDCGTMHPPLRRLVTGDGTLFQAATMVCHCLLVETDDHGLVLIDSGFGTAETARPWRTLGSGFMLRSRPIVDPAQTAVAQVRRLGFDPRDVRHIVLTHLDVDHAGGLADFPRATVHVHAAELAAALGPTTPLERRRYRAHQWSHGPRWATHRDEGETWFGLSAVRALDGLPPQLLLVPLPGHTRGHTGVAVDTGDGWLLHAGDSHFLRSETDPYHPRTTPILSRFQRRMAVDDPARLANLDRLRRLRADHPEQVTVFAAHDLTGFRWFTDPHRRDPGVTVAPAG